MSFLFFQLVTVMRFACCFIFYIVFLSMSPSSDYDGSISHKARSPLEQRDQAQNMFLGRTIDGKLDVDDDEKSKFIDVDTGDFLIDKKDVYGESDFMNYAGLYRKYRMFVNWVPISLCIDAFRSDAAMKCRERADYKLLRLIELNVLNFKFNLVYKNICMYSVWLDGGYRFGLPQKNILDCSDWKVHGGTEEQTSGTFFRFLFGCGRVVNRAKFTYINGKQTGDMILLMLWVGFEFASSANPGGNENLGSELYPYQPMFRLSLSRITEKGRCHSVILGINPFPLVIGGSSSGYSGFKNTWKYFWDYILFPNVSYTCEISLPGFKNVTF